MVKIAMAKITARIVKNGIVKQLKELELYSSHFDRAITTLSRIILDYDDAVEAFENSQEERLMPHTNKAGATNLSKNPRYAVIESLRRDMLDYLRELGLTPAALKRIREGEPQKAKSLDPFAVIEELERDD